jgi:hypothetical protein
MDWYCWTVVCVVAGLKEVATPVVAGAPMVVAGRLAVVAGAVAA